MTARASRRPRAREAKGASRVGARIELEVGPVAHGGHCVARVPASSYSPDAPDSADSPDSAHAPDSADAADSADSADSAHAPDAPDSADSADSAHAPVRDRVVFVRHALPGERVLVEITEGGDGDSFWRADAVEVLEASPDRVPAPCPYARPGGCGGCDFQHVAPAAQRELKAAVVREQLSRLAGLDLDVEVEAVPPTLRWRTRMQYVDLPDGRRGLHQHRSQQIVPVDDCLIDASRAGAEQRHRRPVEGPALETVATTYGTHTYSTVPDGFWQSHLEAPRVLVETVMRALRPAPGERVLDLYAGVGLFAAFLADAVGPTGSVVAVEGDREACRHASANLARELVRAPAAVVHGSVDRVLATSYDEPFDLVVLDPPREGARRKVVEQIVDRAPRGVAYVACDPAALARDLATFAQLGYPLRALTAFDLFPMTHHVECVALVVPA